MSMHAAIIGAGIAGLALAKNLRELGWHIEIYEQAEKLAPVGAGISLTTNALRALIAIDLYEEVVRAGEPIVRLSILDQRGHTLIDTDYARMTERYGHASAVILHRAELHRVLLEQLPPARIHPGRRCTGVRQESDGVELAFADGGTAHAELVFGCDGLHSVLRKALFPQSTEHFAGYTCWRGLSVDRPKGVKSGHISESWGRGRRFGIAPLKDGRVYWFACLHAQRPGDPGLARADVQTLRGLFSGFHAPVDELLRRTEDGAVIWNDIFDVEPLPTFTRGRVALLGDSAHAVTPDLGQGACQALEDVAVLSALLREHPFADAYRIYNDRRLARTRRITLRSRRYAFIAQRRSAAGAQLRNWATQLMPRRSLEREMDALLDVHFEPVMKDEH